MNTKVETREGSGTQGARKVLVADKDLEPGDVIYKEQPVVTVLDLDLQGKGTHCTHCFREIRKGMAIPAETNDPLFAVYCSKPCQLNSKIQSHGLLFTLDPVLPPEVPAPPITPAALEERRKAQALFAEYIKKKGHAAPLLVARFIARQVQNETAKLIPGAVSPEVDYPVADGGDYGLSDHLERLRYLEFSPEQEEMKLLIEVLQHALPGLEQFVTEERHAMLLGKMAYNAYGVCFNGGRDDRPASDERPEDVEKTRTPYGTARQIGCGLYTVSSYLTHSCSPNTRPSFSSGTAELHLIANKPIKKGEELTVAYVEAAQREGESVVECRRRRRMELARGWRFACMCPRCVEESEGLDLPGEGDVLASQKDESKVEATIASFEEREGKL